MLSWKLSRRDELVARPPGFLQCYNSPLIPWHSAIECLPFWSFMRHISTSTSHFCIPYTKGNLAKSKPRFTGILYSMDLFGRIPPLRGWGRPPSHKNFIGPKFATLVFVAFRTKMVISFWPTLPWKRRGFAVKATGFRGPCCRHGVVSKPRVASSYHCDRYRGEMELDKLNAQALTEP